MFDNIGEKIKKLAVILTCICFSCLLLNCAIYIAYGFINNEFEMSNSVSIVIYTAVGLLISLISNFTLYGFGVLICNSETMIEQNEDIIYKIENLNGKNGNNDNHLSYKENPKSQPPFYDYYNPDVYYDKDTTKAVLTLREVRKKALTYPADECKKYVVNSYFSLTDEERKILDPLITLHYNDFYNVLKNM